MDIKQNPMKNPKDYTKKDFEQIKEQLKLSREWLNKKLEELRTDYLHLLPFDKILQGQMMQIDQEIAKFDKKEDKKETKKS